MIKYVSIIFKLILGVRIGKYPRSNHKALEKLGIKRFFSMGNRLNNVVFTGIVPAGAAGDLLKAVFIKKLIGFDRLRLMSGLGIISEHAVIPV